MLRDQDAEMTARRHAERDDLRPATPGLAGRRHPLLPM
jgi:hypothetical protein